MFATGREGSANTGRKPFGRLAGNECTPGMSPN